MYLKSPFLLAAFGAAALAAAAPTYHVRELPLNGPQGDPAYYSAINNLGQTAGADLQNIYLVDAGNTFHFLGTGTYTNAFALNDSGIVAGRIYIGLTWWPCVFSSAYTPNALLMGALLGGVSGSPVAINDAGQMAGTAQGGGFGPSYVHAAEWSAPGGFVTDLGVLPGNTFSAATCINSFGVAAGYSENTYGYESAVIFNGPTPTILPAYDSSPYNQALGINASGVVVGASTDQYEFTFPVLWSGGTVQVLPALPELYGSLLSEATAISDDGSIFGNTQYAAPDGYTRGWVLSGGTTYDLQNVCDDPSDGPYVPMEVSNQGQILARSQSNYNYYVLSPEQLKVSVLQRVDGGTVPDGTVVELKNNNGTALSPPTSATTIAGSVTFNGPPAPAAPNTSYEVVVCLPSGAKGLPAVQNNVGLGQTTIYYTKVIASVSQALTAASPVAFATCKFGTVSASTGISGETPAIWLPDGTYAGSFSMSPGVPCTPSLTLGAAPSSSLVNEGGYAAIAVHLTRIDLTARLANGTTFIPKAGRGRLRREPYQALLTGKRLAHPGGCQTAPTPENC